MIPEVQPVKIHYGNNEATQFDFEFYVESEEHLLVEHTDMAGVKRTLTYGVDYSVEEFGMPDGSKITFPLEDSEYNILAWDDKTGEREFIVISLNLPFSQEAEFDISGDLNKKNLETALDYEMRCIQILNRKIDRAIKVEEGADATPEALMNNLYNAQNISEQCAKTAKEQAEIATEQAEIATAKANDTVAAHERAIDGIEELADTRKNELNALDATIKKDADAIINRVGLNMFDTVTKDHILTYEESKGLALQGTWVYKEAIAGERYGYPDFYNKVVEEFEQATPRNFVYTDTISWTVYDAPNGHMYIDVSEKSKIDTYFEAVGMAWYYILDRANKRVFLPRNNWFEQMSMTQAGKWIAAGLPNITGSSGTLRGADDSGVADYSGAIYRIAYPQGAQSGYTGNCSCIVFDASRSNPIYGKSNTVQPNAVKKLLYICVGNTVSDTSWVDVVTQVQGCVKDLEDKTLEGIERLKASSNALTTTQITNCITEIPNRIKYNINSTGAISLLAGSEVFVNNGNGFESYILETNTPYGGNGLWTTDNARSLFLVYIPAINEVWTTAWDYIFHSTTAPTNFLAGSALWDDTTTGQLKITYDSGANWYICSLPVLNGRAGGTNAGWRGYIDEIFDGFGVFGQKTFVLPAVKYLIFKEKNADGTCKNIEGITTSVVINDCTGRSCRTVFFDGTTVLDYGVGKEFYFEQATVPNVDTQYAYWYSTVENAMYNTSDNGATWKKVSARFYLGTAYKPSGSINFSNMQYKRPFRAVDYNNALVKTDVKNIIQDVMPDYTQILTRAWGTTYKENRSGWIKVQLYDDDNFGESYLFIGNLTLYFFNSQTLGSSAPLFIPVPKGVEYRTSAMKVGEIFFIPAKGELS